MRHNIPILAAFALSIIACTPGKTWVKEGASGQDFSTDSYECEKDARQSGYFGNGLIGAANMNGFVSRCMEAHGYHLESDYNKASHVDTDNRAAAEALCESQGLHAPSKEYSQCFFSHYDDSAAK